MLKVCASLLASRSNWPFLTSGCVIQIWTASDIEWVKSIYPDLPVLISGHGTIETAVQAIRLEPMILLKSHLRKHGY